MNFLQNSMLFLYKTLVGIVLTEMYLKSLSPRESTCKSQLGEKDSHRQKYQLKTLFLEKGHAYLIVTARLSP